MAINYCARALLAGALTGLCGCAAITTKETPDYYPNEKFNRSSDAERYSAERQCESMAGEYVEEPDKYREVVKKGLVGGVVGAGTGAVGGAIFSEAGRGTGAGAAIGGIIGVLKGLQEMNENSPTYERFVEHCLSQKGYQVIGWSSKS